MEKQIKRVFYSVCGWDSKHKYYRTKIDIYDTLEEALLKLESCRDDIKHDYRTCIVKESFYNEVKKSGCADIQQRLFSCSCKGNNAKIYENKNDFGSFTY